MLLVLQQNDLEVSSIPVSSAEVRTLITADDTHQQRYLTVAALPITLLILIMGYFAIRREMRGLFWVFLVGCLAGACYFVYKVSNSRFSAESRGLTF